MAGADPGVNTAVGEQKVTTGRVWVASIGFVWSIRQLSVSLGDVSLVLALTPVIVVPLLLGGVHPQVVVGTAAVEALAVALLLADRRLRKTPLVTSWLALPLALGALFTGFSILPLPETVRRTLSAVGVEQRNWATALLPTEALTEVEPVLSLDPPESALAFLRLLAALCLFVVVVDRCRKREKRALAFRVLLVGALVLFAVSLGHRLANIEQIWGIWGSARTPLFAPLVNGNHLARVFGAFSLLCLGRALSVRSKTEALWFGIGTVTCGAGVFLTLSRGGALAYVAVGIASGLVFARARTVALQTEHPPPLTRTTRWFGAALPQLLLLGAMAVALYLAREALVGEVSTLESARLESSKAALYAPAMKLLEDHWLVGIGVGAFGVALPAVLDGPLLHTYSTFTHAENIIVATLVDHGVVFGAVLFVVGVVVAGFILTALKRVSELASFPALAFLVLGDLFDFALEITAGLLLASVALALCAVHLVARDLTVRRVSIKVGAAVPVGVLIATLTLGPQATADWRRGLDHRLADADGAARQRLLERALARHPLDAQYAYELAVEARRRRDPVGALRWANRALILWPLHQGAHVEAARALAAQGHLPQAMLEYREAWRAAGASPRLITEVARRTPDVGLRRRAVPEGDPRALALICEHLVAVEKRLIDAQACFDEASAMPGSRSDNSRRAIELALQRDDSLGASRRLDAFLDGRPPSPRMASLAAEVIARRDGLDVALKEVDGWLQGAGDTEGLLQWKLDAMVKLQRYGEAHHVLARLRALASDAKAVDAVDRGEADLLVRMSEKPRALRVLQRVTSRAPQDVPVLAQQATLEIDLELHAAARETVARLVRLAPKDGRVQALVERLRAIDEHADAGRLKRLLDR